MKLEHCFNTWWGKKIPSNRLHKWWESNCKRRRKTSNEAPSLQLKGFELWLQMKLEIKAKTNWLGLVLIEETKNFAGTQISIREENLLGIKEVELFGVWQLDNQIFAETRSLYGWSSKQRVYVRDFQMQKARRVSPSIKFQMCINKTVSYFLKAQIFCSVRNQGKLFHHCLRCELNLRYILL